jgi:hypothetical protein
MGKKKRYDKLDLEEQINELEIKLIESNKDMNTIAKRLLTHKDKDNIKKQLARLEETERTLKKQMIHLEYEYFKILQQEINTWERNTPEKEFYYNMEITEIKKKLEDLEIDYELMNDDKYKGGNKTKHLNKKLISKKNKKIKHFNKKSIKNKNKNPINKTIKNKTIKNS